MSATPPHRLMVLAEPSSALAHGLTAARRRGPSEDELRALEQNLAAALGGATLLGAAAAAATAKTGGVVAGAPRAWLSATAMKVTTVVVLAAAGTTGAVAWRRHATLREHATAIAVGPTTPAAPAPPAIVTAPTPTGPEAVTPPPSSTPARFPETSPSPAVRAGALRSRHGDAARAGVGASRLAVGLPNGEESALGEELTLIERAQHALPEDPSGALTLVEEHQRRFGERLLAQEREVIAVAALSKLGRTVDARARAERFLRRYPDSAHVARVRRLAAASARTP